MRALITGGTGYVASHLAQRLLSGGFAVRATRRRLAGPELVANAIEWIDVPDIGPETDWRAALDGIDVVFHLAGVAHRLTMSQAAIEEEYDRVNALGTQRIAQSLVARGGVARLVLLSSVGAVCTTSDAVITAATEPHPDSIYGRSKLRAEQLLAAACAGSSIAWCALRAPLVYGPGAPGNMRRLLKLALRGIPLPLGLARAQRSFVYVGNLVDALAHCARSSNVAGRVLMVADDETTSVADLLELVGQLQGRRVRLLPVPMSLMNGAARVIDALRARPKDRGDRLTKSLELLFGSLVLDASELRTSTHWRAPYSLREGMSATIARGDLVA